MRPVGRAVVFVDRDGLLLGERFERPPVAVALSSGVAYEPVADGVSPLLLRNRTTVGRRRTRWVQRRGDQAVVEAAEQARLYDVGRAGRVVDDVVGMQVVGWSHPGDSATCRRESGAPAFGRDGESHFLTELERDAAAMPEHLQRAFPRRVVGRGRE